MSELKLEKQPTTPTATEIGKATKHENPYIDVVFKRLRSLKKRWDKIEKYDQVINTNAKGKEELIPDQIQAWERRDEVSSAIRELEDIIKRFTVIDAEETKARIAQTKEQERQLKRITKKITKETEASAARIVFNTVGLFHGVYHMVPTLENPSVVELQQIVTFKEVVISKFIAEDKTKAQKDVYNSLKELTNLSPCEIPEMTGVHYQDISLALTTLILPPKENEPIPEEETRGIEFSSEDLEHVHYDGDDTVVIHEVIIPPGGISFMSTSEILEDDLIKQNSPANGIIPSPTMNEESRSDLASPNQNLLGTEHRLHPQNRQHRGYRGKRSHSYHRGQHDLEGNHRGGSRGRRGRGGMSHNNERHTRGKGKSRGNRGRGRGRGRGQEQAQAHSHPTPTLKT